MKKYKFKAVMIIIFVLLFVQGCNLAIDSLGGLNNNEEKESIIKMNDVIAKGAKGDGVTDDSKYFSTTLDNYIEKDKICALSISKFKSIHTTFKGEGKIRILDMPYSSYKQPSHPQGTISPKDMSEEILMDMNLPNEGIPAGAQRKQKISGTYPFDDISMPSNYNFINAWGQIFIKEGLSYPTESYIYIENFTLVVYRNSTKKWEIMNRAIDIGGMFFDANYSEGGSIPKLQATYTKTDNGIKVKIDSSAKNRCFHFYPLAGDRFNVVPSDVKFIVAYFDVYTDTDVADNVFVANVGADYKGNKVPIREAANGRFKNITKTKRRVYATNLDYNNYFDFCDQKLIDGLN